MYIEGDEQDLEDRIHSLCVTEEDYDAYKAERDTYTDAPEYLQNYWDKEFMKRRQILEKADETPE